MSFFIHEVEYEGSDVIFELGFFRKTVGVIGLCMGLSGCLESGTAGTGQPVRSVALADGQIVVRALDTFCIDQTSLRQDADGSFALLADCQVLKGTPIRPAQELGVLTVTVSAPNNEGTASASLPNPLPGAKVLRESTRNGLQLYHLAEGGNAILPQSDPIHWRGVFRLNGRVVALAAYGPKDGPVVKSQGGAILTTLAANIRKASPKTTQ